ncbi:MAG: PA4642 family protein [Halopseudomonas sabulinigri]|tara:strand:- start:9254 stop:9544 length:291 start_codon:yes stop_codon:yes gene_type:complete
MRKDKEKVVGEPMTDEQVAVFLQARPYADESVDLHLLVRAYRGLRAEDFARFLVMFKGEGFDLNATDEQGNTFLQTVKTHAQGEDYVNVLEAAGAR